MEDLTYERPSPIPRLHFLRPAPQLGAEAVEVATLKITTTNHIVWSTAAAILRNNSLRWPLFHATEYPRGSPLDSVAIFLGIRERFVWVDMQ